MRYILILTLVMLCCACTKKETKPAACVTQCYYKGVTAIISGFSKEEADSVDLRAYKRNGRFDSLVKEEKTITPHSAMHSDLPNINLGYLSTDKDYVISVPATSHSFSITMTVSEVVDTIPCNSPTCYIFSPGVRVSGGKTSLTVSGGQFHMNFEK